MKIDAAATKQDIQDIINLIGNFMEIVNDRFHRIEATSSMYWTILSNHQARLSHIKEL